MCVEQIPSIHRAMRAHPREEKLQVLALRFLCLGCVEDCVPYGPKLVRLRHQRVAAGKASNDTALDLVRGQPTTYPGPQHCVGNHLAFASCVCTAGGIVCVCSRIVGGEPFNQNMRPAARQPLSSQMPLMQDVAAAMDAHRKCQIIQATGAIALHNLAQPTGLYNALELKAYLKQVCMGLFRPASRSLLDCCIHLFADIAHTNCGSVHGLGYPFIRGCAAYSLQ